MPAVEKSVSVESIGNLERRMTFSLPAEHLETQVGGRLREIARGAKIKGFRPGKVPAKVIEQRYGKQVRAEILDGLLRESFGSAVRENELQIAGNPKIEPVDKGEGLAYVATFEVVPDFGDIDVAALKIVRDTAEVKDEDIDTMVDNLRLQRRTWNPVERAAQEGDAVELETFSTVDGERLPAEGAERGATVVGSAAMFPAIEAALVGMKAGEEKTVEVEFPASWRVPQFAGRKVELPDNAHESFMEAARKRVLVGLLVGEVARRNELKLDPKRVSETLNLIASTYEEPQQVIELYRQDQQLMQGLQGRVMEEQVIDWIAERAQHTEQPMSFSEAIRQ